MPNLDPWINQYENDQQIITITTIAEKATNSKFENHLLSVKTECQKIINSHQHPTFLERYQKIIEMIDWTLERYRTVIQRNEIQQQQNEPDLVIINRIREELDEKRKIAIYKNKQSELRDEVACIDLKKLLLIMYYLKYVNLFILSKLG
ncbi:MAG TPA: hypothetical protein VLA74_10380 [Nitrososphaeraceae archaeon]|nr:hypothetical protein [Nitrososphaeraceae archaeon]